MPVRQSIPFEEDEMRIAAICGLFLLIGAGTATASPEKAPAWHIMGTLSESCSCAVPCACNFGEAPSPHAFCWAVFATTIDKGNFGSVSLDGLKVGGANGAKGFVLYLDDRATPEQVAALKA